MVCVLCKMETVIVNAQPSQPPRHNLLWPAALRRRQSWIFTFIGRALRFVFGDTLFAKRDTLFVKMRRSVLNLLCRTASRRCAPSDAAATTPKATIFAWVPKFPADAPPLSALIASPSETHEEILARFTPQTTTLVASGCANVTIATLLVALDRFPQLRAASLDGTAATMAELRGLADEKYPKRLRSIALCNVALCVPHGGSTVVPGPQVDRIGCFRLLRRSVEANPCNELSWQWLAELHGGGSCVARLAAAELGCWRSLSLLPREKIQGQVLFRNGRTV